ncbi:MCH1 [Candida pseudojiufengensis]|uniref:MCH1 n=1 Tax=Candida pseudojiufengensis TaxID=497109 RepID=UPI0022246EC5|nr:MCH1 [Candida pseudojiufengensis]KAI5965148.1 MCH1 [Candida pseudojiufengensis]
MKLIQNVSYKIKAYLSQHISLTNLRLLAFFISLISCLVSGSILLFTLFTPSFHEILGLSYLQINFIASLSAGGMYLCLPVLGYLSDCYGPSILSFLSVWFFVPSYGLNSYLIQIGNNNIIFYCITFCMIGLATSSLYFSSLLSCAKIFPKQKGLAISLPISCYGLSSLMGSQLLKLKYFKLDNSDLLNLVKVFNFFAWLYLIMGIFSFISSSIVLVEQEVLYDLEEVDVETTPLISNNEPLTPQRSIRSIDPPNHKQRYFTFLKDYSAWIILISLILNVGPLESYQNNLSSITTILEPIRMKSNLSDKVGLLAFCSTITRLIVGGLSDLFNKKKLNSVWILIIVIIFGIIGQWNNNIIFNGISYGGVFTIYPTIVASVWGIDIMGSTWGSFMVAPAIGSIVFSLFYGKIADRDGDSQTNVLTYFKITSFSLFISCILVLLALRIWKRRGQVLV